MKAKKISLRGFQLERTTEVSTFVKQDHNLNYINGSQVKTGGGWCEIFFPRNRTFCCARLSENAKYY